MDKYGRSLHHIMRHKLHWLDTRLIALILGWLSSCTVVIMYCTVDFVYNKVVRFVRIFIVLDISYLVNYLKLM